MQNYRKEIEERLNVEEKYRDRLFCRDFFLTNDSIDCIDSYPFYGMWKKTCVDSFTLLVHPLETVFVVAQDGITMALVGYAVDPFENVVDENVILRNLISAYSVSENCFQDKIDQLTGVFVIFVFKRGELIIEQDCSSPKMVYYGHVNGFTVAASSPQLIADIYDLERDKAVEKLVDSKGYKRGSGFLPGNISPYAGIKRLGCNTLLREKNGSFSIERFFPREQCVMLKTEEEKQAKTEEMRALLSKNISLLRSKWDRVCLSLTGGMDSRTEFACAGPDYDDLFIFSFASKPSEQIDADAAAEICKQMGVPHHFYKIPDDESEIEDYDFLQKILEHSLFYCSKMHPNEKRKFIWLEKQNDFDAELKADVSEIGRAYLERKYYNVKMPRKLSPRHFTITQGRYFMEPRMMCFCDNAFRSFMDETSLTEDLYGYSMHDLAYWEVRMGSWAATCYTMTSYIYQILMAYNNRNLMKMFLQFPKEERAKDIPHQRIIRSANPQLADIELHIKDSYFGFKRMLLETVYYYYATRLNTMHG